MTPTDGPEPRRRLAELMDDRRIELDLAWEEVARRAGMTGMTLRRIRNGEGSLPRRTAAKIDRALEWQPGSVEGILTGGDPSPIQMDMDEQDHEALKVIHKMNTRLFGLEEADRRLEQDIREINAARDRTRRRSSERPEIA